MKQVGKKADMASSDMSEIAMMRPDFSNVGIVHTYALVEPAKNFNTAYDEYHLSFQPLLYFLLSYKDKIYVKQCKNKLIKIIHVRTSSNIIY
jgi:hypothetical protein